MDKVQAVYLTGAFNVAQTLLVQEVGKIDRRVKPLPGDAALRVQLMNSLQLISDHNDAMQRANEIRGY